MLLALVGVSGIGKTYFKEKISEKLLFNKINTIRTRAKRMNEKDNDIGLFMTMEELGNWKANGKIIYDLNLFGSTYAYLKEEILSKENMIFEMHYTMIPDWKKIRPDMKSIYILPIDISLPIKQVQERKLTKEKEEERIKEMKEQYKIMSEDEDLRSMFDYIIYNNYDKQSEENIINLVKRIMDEEK